MKKALLMAMCFVLVSFALVNGTFALPNLEKVFQAVSDLLDKAVPEDGGGLLDVDLVSDDKKQMLLPGGEASRTFHVKNKGSAEAYFRLVCAIQYEESSWDKLTIDFAYDEDSFIEHDWKDIEIGEDTFRMWTFTYKNALLAGGESPKVGVSIAMASDVTNEQMKRYRSDFIKMQALAIETESFNKAGFDSAEKALEAALPLGTLNPF